MAVSRIAAPAAVVLAAFALASGEPDAGRASLDLVVVVPGSHLDVGFTDVPSQVLAARVRTLDEAIDAATADPGFRWTEEAGWVVHEWLAAHAKDPARLATARDLVRAGRIGIGASYVNPHAALFPRSLHLLFAFHEEVERAFGVRPSFAVLNDVPAYPEALVDAAAAAGVRGFLIGANLSFSAPLPPALASGPFVWRSAAGARVVVSIDPDSYTSAFTKWGIDPATSRFFARDRFVGKEGLDLAAASIAEMGAGRTGTVAVQQAFDNWGLAAARRLPAFVREWGASRRTPRVVAGTPADAFAAWDPAALPVREGEWGGEWEEVRAGCPHTTARLRRAADAMRGDAPLPRRLALAVAMDHTGSLGGPWPGTFTEVQARAHAAEWARMLREAIGDSPDPREADRREGGAKPDLGALAAVLDAAALSAGLVRAPRSLGAAYFPAGRPRADAAAGVEARAGEATLWARLDRASIPGDEVGNVDVGWDVPLRAARAQVRAWPRGSASGEKGAWLKGAPPSTFVAPEGLVVETPQGRVLFASEHAFAYRVADLAGRAHVQALLVRQSRLCVLKGGAKAVLPFDALYPGEPARLAAELTIRAVP